MKRHSLDGKSWRICIKKLHIKKICLFLQNKHLFMKVKTNSFCEKRFKQCQIVFNLLHTDNCCDKESYLYDLLSTSNTEETFFKDFSWKSEATTSEYLVNLKDKFPCYYMQSDGYNIFSHASFYYPSKKDQLFACS